MLTGHTLNAVNLTTVGESKLVLPQIRRQPLHLQRGARKRFSIRIAGFRIEIGFGELET